VHSDGLAGKELSERAKRLVHASTTCLGIDAGDLNFVTVFASDAHSERETSGCYGGERGQLSCDQHRVAERQQVHRDVNGELRMSGREYRRLDDAVEALPTVEAHVVPDADVVDVVLGDAFEQRPDGTDVADERVTRDAYTYLHIGSAVVGNRQAHEVRT